MIVGRFVAALRRAGVWCVTACLIMAASSAHAQIPETIRSSAIARVNQGWNPAIVIGVVDGTGTHFFSAGTTILRAGRPVDEHTIFEIGSITKVFTGLLLARMAGEGEVRLDDPVAALLPKSVTVPQRDNELITLRRLATHRSGLPEMPTNMRPSHPDNPYAGYDSALLYQFLNSYSLPRAPGAQYGYSNVGSGLLGFALSQRAGMDYERLLRLRILDPLGLRATGIAVASDRRDRLAIGHTETEPTSAWDFDVLAGAGALRSSAADLVSFLAVATGLRESALDAAFAAALGGSGQGTNDGFGWSRLETGNRFHAGGRTGGFRSFIGIDRERRRGIVVLSNSIVGIDDLGIHFLDPSWPLTLVRPSMALSRDALLAYVGEYQSATGLTVNVRLEGSQAIVRVAGLGTANVYPSAENEFFARLANVQLRFARDETGRVSGLTLWVNGRDTDARRVK